MVGPRFIQKGATNVSVTVKIIDDTDGTPELGVLWNTAGMDMEYRREGSVAINVTEATLAALTTAHADGGFLEIGHGLYRFDLPDAAFATGQDGVQILGTVTGMIVIAPYIQLVDFDPFDAVRLGLTALPNAAADAGGGLPISDAGGLDLDTQLAATNEVTAARMAALTDWINGGRLDLLLDAIPTTAMRGTDSALTDKAGFSLSTAGILAVWHQALSAVVTAGSVGLLLKDEITAVRMAVLTDWIDGGRLDALLDAIPTTAMRGTDGANTTTPLTAAQVNTEVDNALNTAIPGTPTANSINERLAALDDLLQAAGGGDAAAIKTAADAIKALLDTTVMAERASGAPPATPAGLVEAVMYMYMALRNGLVATATERRIRNDAGTVIAKATMSDDATTFDAGELGAP